MVMYLQEACVPTSKFALMNNFCLLHDIVIKPGEALEAYFSRFRNTVTLLREGKVELHQILIILFAIRGLDAHYR